MVFWFICGRIFGSVYICANNQVGNGRLMSIAKAIKKQRRAINAAFFMGLFYLLVGLCTQMIVSAFRVNKRIYLCQPLRCTDIDPIISNDFSGDLELDHGLS